MIWGEGNPKAPILVILDNPGERENREGNPYICGTRQTFQQAVHDVGLNRMTYISHPFSKENLSAHTIKKRLVRFACSIWINSCRKKKPSLILCLGNVAVQSFFQDSETEVKTLRGSWHEVQGYPTTVAYHPLAVRRRPNLHSLFMQDLALVAERFHRLNP